MKTRRDVVRSAAAAACLTSLAPLPAWQNADALDQALELLENTGPEYGGGLSNHGPMTAEALAALGRPAAIRPWVEQYKSRLQSFPDSRNLIARAAWRESLGDYRRVGDWIAFFERELKEKSWNACAGEWVPRLAPGLSSAAMHGLIRTGQAARSLGVRETPLRQRELAEGLGYWASRYLALPAPDEQDVHKLHVAEALRQVQLLPESQREGGSILGRLQKVKEFAPFAQVAGLVDSSGDVARFVSELTEAFAAVFLANTQRGAIAFVHSVTGPSAIRLLLPHLPPEARHSMLVYGWQAAAGIYTGFAAAPAAAVPDAVLAARDELIDRAIATRDEHAIKFTEACLREHALNPKPVYLLAAERASARLKRD